MTDKTNSQDPFKFSDQVDQASWELLKQHYDRGGVFLVDDSLDIVDVANAIATDSVDLVKGWLESELLRPLKVEEAQEWEKMPNEKVVNFLIVQPYVIVKKILKN